MLVGLAKPSVTSSTTPWHYPVITTHAIGVTPFWFWFTSLVTTVASIIYEEYSTVNVSAFPITSFTFSNIAYLFPHVGFHLYIKKAFNSFTLILFNWNTCGGGGEGGVLLIGNGDIIRIFNGIYSKINFHLVTRLPSHFILLMSQSGYCSSTITHFKILFIRNKNEFRRTTSRRWSAWLNPK